MAEKEIMHGVEFQSMTMLLDDLTIDPEWNNRTSLWGEDTFKKGKFPKGDGTDNFHGPARDSGEAPATAGNEVKDLADLIKKSKMLTPPTVSLRKDGTKFLVAGFRRVEAVKSLGWKMIPVMAKVMTPSEEIQWNLIENTARKNLTTYEQARGCLRMAESMKAEGISPSKGGRGVEGYAGPISSSLKISRTAVNLYLRLFAKLHPVIINAWEGGDSWCSLNRLDKIASEKADAQLKLYKAKDVEPDTGDEDAPAAGGGGGTRTAPADRPKMVRMLVAEFALLMAEEVANEAEDPEKLLQVKGVKDALAWAMGKKKTLMGFNVEDRMAKRKADAVAEAKAEKDAAAKAKEEAKK